MRKVGIGYRTGRGIIDARMSVALSKNEMDKKMPGRHAHPNMATRRRKAFRGC